MTKFSHLCLFQTHPMRLKFLCGFLLSFLISQGQLDTAAISAKLRENKELSKNVVCLIFKNGKVLYKKDTPEFTVKAQQNIGATSQWLTAALVMTYVQEGKLSLDSKVSQFIPEYSKYSKGYITIRHCLTHATGIESDFNISKLFQKSKFKTLEEEALAFASKREIETNPGTEFKYSNIGFALAGRVLEIISKKGFERIMADRILRPLGMRGSNFTNEDFNAAIDPFMGGRSTANDLTNFLTMLLNKGVFNNKQILTEASVNTILNMQSPGPLKNVPKPVEGFTYTNGAWIIEQDAKGNTTAATSPSLSGTWPIVDICRGYTLVVLTNGLKNPPDKNFYLDLKAIIDEGIPAKCN